VLSNNLFIVLSWIPKYKFLHSILKLFCTILRTFAELSSPVKSNDHYHSALSEYDLAGGSDVNSTSIPADDAT
jgi:hypothetical protein